MTDLENKKKKPDYVILILCVILAVSAVGLIVVLCLPEKKGEFVAPAFEEAAKTGIPVVDEKYGYTELYREGMAYRVSVCGIPAADGNALTVYFTNAEENDCYLKLRVLDENDKILGETGLLRPNEYVETVTLTKKIASGTPLKLKVMSYQPETYESVGSVLLSVKAGS